MPKPSSLKEKRQRLQQSTFVGRTEHLAAFRENILRDPDDLHFVNIFNIFGQGGVGKTTLSRQFIQIAEQFGASYAYTDEGVKDVPDFMGQVAEQLEKAGHDLQVFIKRYKLYRQKKQELEADPERPQDFGEFVGANIVRVGTSILKGTVPGAAPMMEWIDTDSWAKQAGAWASFVAKKLGNKDEVQLLLEPVKVLTPLWLRALGDITEDKKLCLFVDTYEIVGNTLENWLLDLVDDDQYSSGIILVLSGRDRLDANRWSAHQDITIPLSVEPFTEEEAREYLTRRGVTDEMLVQSILTLSGRLPVLLATLAESSPHAPEDLADVSQTAVERFLRWVDDPVKRKAAQVAALPREINQDIIGVLVADGAPEALYDWLGKMPFFERRGGRYTYHPVVREQMLRYLRTKSPKTWSELHEKLAAYYEALQAELGLEPGSELTNERWRQRALEALYHRFCAHPEACAAFAINGFARHFIEKTGYGLAWAETVQAAEQDCACFCPFLKGSDLVALAEAYESNDYAISLKQLHALLNYSGLDESFKAEIHRIKGSQHLGNKDYQSALEHFGIAIEIKGNNIGHALVGRGETYCLMQCYEDALRDFDKAIELNKKDAWAFALRAETYREIKRYEETLRDLDKAIELNDKYAWAFAHRAETYRLMQRYEEALHDFAKAVELDDTYAWAFALRAETYRQIQRYEEALHNFDKAIELNDKDPWSFALRAETNNQLQLYEEALRDFDKTLELDERYTWAYAHRAETYRLIQRYEEALRDFDKAIELDEKYAWAFARRAETYRLQQRYEEALRDFDKVIELDKQYAWAYSGRAETYLQRGEYLQASADLKKALEIGPESNWYSFLLYATEKKLDREEARQHLEQAIDLARQDLTKDPGDILTAFNLVLYLACRSDEQAALEQASAAASRADVYQLSTFQRDLVFWLTLFPGHPSVQKMLEWVERQLEGKSGISGKGAAGL